MISNFCFCFRVLFVWVFLEIGESHCKENHLPLFGLQIRILAYWVFLIMSVILAVSLVTVPQLYFVKTNSLVPKMEAANISSVPLC